MYRVEYSNYDGWILYGRATTIEDAKLLEREYQSPLGSIANPSRIVCEHEWVILGEREWNRSEGFTHMIREFICECGKRGSKIFAVPDEVVEEE